MSQRLLKKFIEIYHRQYGVELTEADARSKAADFLSLYRAIGAPQN